MTPAHRCRRLLRCALWLALTSATASARAEEAPRVWRVCVSDIAAPPYLYNDPKRLGLAERLMVDAGRQLDLSVLLLRYPSRRCRLMLDAGSIDATVAAPTASNLAAGYLFPMKAGTIDASKRVARLNMVWIKRADSRLDFDGQKLLGAEGDPLIGVRSGLRVAIDPLLALNLRVDEGALSARQLLMKVMARRVDAAVALQEDVEQVLADPALSELVVLPKPLMTSDFYAVTKPGLPAPLQQKVEAWWSLIGKLRDSPPYQRELHMP